MFANTKQLITSQQIFPSSTTSDNNIEHSVYFSILEANNFILITWRVYIWVMNSMFNKGEDSINVII